MNFYDKQPKLVNDEPSKLKEHFRKGITTLLVIGAGVLFFFCIYRFTSITSAFEKFFEVLAPITYGFVFAFLLNPMVMRVEKFLKPRLHKLFGKEKTAQKVSRIVGILVAFLFVIAIVVALLNMLIPELYKSIRDLIITLPDDLRTFGDTINNMIEGNSTSNKLLKSFLLEANQSLSQWATTDLVKWAQNDLLTYTGTVVSSVTAGVVSIVNVVLNLFVGIIVAVYLLFSKETFLRQGKKIVYALFKPKTSNGILHIARKANEIFSGFIIGKIIDSAIIGVLCFIGLTILRMPYALLVSVIVGVTNVIPFFGPFIGAIPSTILILLVDPMKGLWFVLFVLLLQQLDGNVIGPKILGDSTGLSSFWVVFSILISGGLFGFEGMILGVPTFALIYYVVKMFIIQKLEQKNLPIDTAQYTEKTYVDESGNFVLLENQKPDEEESSDADSRTE